jgi:hypothetical protein
VKKDDVGWIHLVWDRNQWETLINKVTNYWIPFSLALKDGLSSMEIGKLCKKRVIGLIHTAC